MKLAGIREARLHVDRCKVTSHTGIGTSAAPYAYTCASWAIRAVLAHARGLSIPLDALCSHADTENCVCAGHSAITTRFDCFDEQGVFGGLAGFLSRPDCTGGINAVRQRPVGNGARWGIYQQNLGAGEKKC